MNSVISMPLVIFIAIFINIVASFKSVPHYTLRSYALQLSSSNSDLFGTGSSPVEESPSEEIAPEVKPVDIEKAKSMSAQVQKFKDEAEQLRKEAAQMEVAMREEARAKGVPEEMINKLMPLRNIASKKASLADGSVAVKEKVETKKFTAEEVRNKLGYLNAGDAVRVTTELDRIAGKGILQKWNSRDISKATFATNSLQFKTKTNIDPIKLKLDDVGYNYQNVFISALAMATVFGLASSTVGGQLGFYLGYLSALLPIGLVGLGSIAPGLIGDILNRGKYIIDAEAKEKFVKMNAGKFLAGYAMGLPISTFKTGGFSNQVEFFQVRPTGNNAADKQMFARNKFKQTDIARSSVVMIAGSVAECMYYGEGTGTNAGDVNTLYELMNTCDPPLKPEQLQNHIRWSAVTAYEILDENRGQYEKLCEAFATGLPLEECIAVLEGTKSE